MIQLIYNQDTLKKCILKILPKIQEERPDIALLTFNNLAGYALPLLSNLFINASIDTEGRTYVFSKSEMISYLTIIQSRMEYKFNVLRLQQKVAQVMSSKYLFFCAPPTKYLELINPIVINRKQVRKIVNVILSLIQLNIFTEAINDCKKAKYPLDNAMLYDFFKESAEKIKDK